jgi:iron-sulfur cluster repair protein YtfE (RIC family)
MPGRRYTKEILVDAVDVPTSIAGVLRHLGIVQSGGGHAHISRTIKKFGIDTSHFTGQAKRLRRALLALGRPHECEECGNDGEWRGKPISLHVDHIDGRHWDNRPENLRFLCPNCHAATSTYAGRNRRRGAASTLPWVIDS